MPSADQGDSQGRSRHVDLPPSIGRVDRWWPALVLVFLVLALYATRMSEPDPRGEETRRAQVAVEMLDSGDFVVPRQQGEPFFGRPPFQNWLIALGGLLRGGVDVVAMRLPSVLAVLATTLLIYFYSASFLSPLGAMAASVAYATMLQVLEIGRSGETEAVFAFLVGGALLVWHWGDTQGWPGSRKWGLAYLMVALGVLTKGPQAPVYFGLSVFGWLFWTRRWRELLGRDHLVGAMVFLGMWAAWQAPYTLELGLRATRRIYADEVGHRFTDLGVWSYLRHLAAYPVHLLLGCLLPWSVLLLAFLGRDFRRSLGAARGHVLFLGWSVGAAFLTCWVVPNARPRYFMPLYPCIAPMIGLVAQRCWDAPPDARWGRLWRRFVAAMACAMPAAGLFFLATTWLDHPRLPLAQPWPFAITYLLVAAVLAAVAWWSRAAATAAQRALGMLAVAGFLGLTVAGAFVNVQIRNGVQTRQAVAEVRRKLPENVQLVSFGRVDHLFAYHFRDAIRMAPPPEAGRPPGSDPTWFCFGGEGAPKVEVPFPYEVVGTVCCDRFPCKPPRRVVVVGRRIPEYAAAGQTPQRR